MGKKNPPSTLPHSRLTPGPISPKRRRTGRCSSETPKERTGETKLVLAKRVQQVVIKHSTSIGLITDGSAPWEWQLGSEGSLAWIARASVVRGAPVRFVPSLETLTPVEVLLSLGSWPNMRNPCWKWQQLRLVIHCWVKEDMSSSRRVRRGGKTPPDWRAEEVFLKQSASDPLSGRYQM